MLPISGPQHSKGIREQWVAGIEKGGYLFSENPIKCHRENDQWVIKESDINSDEIEGDIRFKGMGIIERKDWILFASGSKDRVAVWLSGAKAMNKMEGY